MWMERGILEESCEWYRKNAVSWRNEKFYNIRKKVFSKNIYKKCEFVGNDLWVYFLIYPTYGRGIELVKIYDEHGEEHWGYFYDVIISFVNVKDYLMNEFLKLSWSGKLRAVVMLYYIWDNVKFYANDPSFFVQGAWYRLHKRGASVYPFPAGFKDNGIWARRHGKDLYLTKHILAVLDIFKFNSSSIANDLIKIIKKMKDEEEKKKKKYIIFRKKNK